MKAKKEKQRRRERRQKKRRGRQVQASLTELFTWLKH